MPVTSGRGRNWRTDIKILDDGQILKKCNGPMHQDGGEYLPVERFPFRRAKEHPGGRVYKKQYRRSQCVECNNAASRKRNRKGDWVPITKWAYIFRELEIYFTQAEICRRIGVTAQSYTIWKQVATKNYKVNSNVRSMKKGRRSASYLSKRWRMKKIYVERAIVLLAEIRAQGRKAA
jgi:hypothetical protein